MSHYENIDNPYHVESCKPYRVEVIADSSGKYCGNGLTFPTVDKASEYARDLFGRWTLVTAWRVVDAEGKVVVRKDYNQTEVSTDERK